MIFPDVDDGVAAEVILLGVLAELAVMASGARPPTCASLAVLTAAQCKALDLMSMPVATPNHQKRVA